jgi:hypothetical protein
MSAAAGRRHAGAEQGTDFDPKPPLALSTELKALWMQHLSAPRGIGQSIDNGSIEFVDDIFRRALRGEQTKPR